MQSTYWLVHQTVTDGFKKINKKICLIHILGKKIFTTLWRCFSCTLCKLFICVNREKTQNTCFEILKAAVSGVDLGGCTFFPQVLFLLHGLLLLKHKYYLSSKIKRQLFSFRKIVKTLWEWCKSENKDQWTRIRIQKDFTYKVSIIKTRNYVRWSLKQNKISY